MGPSLIHYGKNDAAERTGFCHANCLIDQLVFLESNGLIKL
jgi:hypothetical protein